MITKQIPQFIAKYCNLNDKGLFWEMIKMEKRASTIIFAKNKAKQKRHEEKDLLMRLNRRLNQLQEKLRSNFSETTKVELDRVKKELAKIVNKKKRGAMTRSKAQWYEVGEKNNKYFYKVEKINHKKKNISSLTKEDGNIVLQPKQILEEEERFFSKKFINPKILSKHFFDGLNTPKQEEADTCEGAVSTRTNSLKQFRNNKTPGSDGFTIEFYRFFWNAIGPIMVDSFNYAFEIGEMAISQKRGIISLIPKKDKDKKYLKNWRPISLLNSDYKIVTKALALRLEKCCPRLLAQIKQDT